MKIPGFRAEAALGPAAQPYGNYCYDGLSAGVQLAQLSEEDVGSDNGDCYGGCLDQCLEGGASQSACEQQCSEACFEGGAT